MIPDLSITLTGWTAVWVLSAAVFGAFQAIRILLMMPRLVSVGGGGG